tara:strand:+ start:2705 stop:3814 length:1110 start_codon:yes stop_codon:yes gene_type:complete
METYTLQQVDRIVTEQICDLLFSKIYSIDDILYSLQNASNRYFTVDNLIKHNVYKSMKEKINANEIEKLKYEMPTFLKHCSIEEFNNLMNSGYNHNIECIIGLNHIFKLHQLSLNKNIHPEDILKHGIVHMDIIISRSLNLTSEFIMKNPTIGFSREIFKNPNIDINYLLSLGKICWHYLSQHPQLKFDIIKDNIDKPWNWQEISKHPNIYMDYIEEYPKQPFKWNWVSISCNPNITISFIKKYKDKLHKKTLFDNCSYLIIDYFASDVPFWTSNDKVPYEIVKTHPELSDKLLFKRNPMVTPEYIKKFSILNDLITNSFDYIYNTYSQNIYKKNFKIVLNEYMETLLVPDNMELAKKLGVYSGVTYWH